MGRAETVHGFRSSFRDWAAEQTNHPREVCEHALAHRVPGAIETAYLRSDLLERRRVLMDEWAAWCLGDWCATKNGPPRAAPIPGPNADVTKPGAGPGIREITLD
jgi:hypothetical protein